MIAATLALIAAGCSSKANDEDEGGGGGGSELRVDDGVTATTIPLGVLTDMTGVYATLGKSVTQAQQLYFDELNAAGGVCGREVELTVRDHGYDPQKAVSAYTELEPEVLGFPQFIGSPYVAAVKDRIDTQDKGLVIPQAWSATLLGSENIRQIGATYDVEMINAVDFLVQEGFVDKGDKIGHVYFEGDYGENALAGSEHAAGAAGLTVVGKKIKATDQDMTAQVTSLAKAEVSAILMSAGPRQSASLAGVAAASGLDVPVVGSNPTFAPQLLETAAGPALLKNFYVSTSTLPIGSAEPGPAELSAAYEKEYPGELLDTGVIAGWAAADLFGEALKRACEAKNLTREGVTEALLSIDSMDTGLGITHDFSDPAEPSTRESFILRPDDEAKGGMVVAKEAFTAAAAADYAAEGAGG
ncbi:ABC transporter substrate-binding protein [Streptomyces sp. WMMC500]|uniref:ABC transporter substrate-binding protein n=1 Tax=Streptomyces sp. WMMC500 TaxID=3015154 RepID=UPI00248B7A07|nr:ABC transporter substrate-binding protein [Streptomyces sp. WMMC500]WBB62124.1 ABC transporter substrate-binding protein [Streptomyces sp. WMMC500]